ncbi:hypothetical protein C2G38_2219965 [Gigaspora rosea]|uniref:Uncharacterized protein n=1 Tax=Gigaspora rosea TaxID=44941 RepID=A0A397U6H5_9GLOM|nr:hypothetical protein C2G38_2219965 [Gigaspora rosea]
MSFNVSNVKPDSSKVYKTIINTLKDMSETDLKSTSHLLPCKLLETLNGENKQLKKENKKLQQSKNRATHKVRQLSGSIMKFKRKHRHHISQIRAVAKCPPELKDNDLKTIIRNLIKQNKKDYNKNFINLTLQTNQVGVKKNISGVFYVLEFRKNIPDVVLLETKDLRHCNSDTVSQALFESYKKYKLDTRRCLTFLSDNTNYMSVLNNFEETAFNKLPTNTGFSKTRHPFNLLYLFSQEFYRPFAEFLIGYDPQLKVLQPDHSLQCLPSGELLQSTEILDNLEIELLVQKLENKIQKELELHQKWLNCWLHLPLSMCRIGGNNAQQFACNYWHIVEGLFNKWDIKTHPKMTNNTQQSRMCLSATEIKEYQFNHKQLKDIRSENRIIYQQNSTTSLQLDRHDTDDLFKELFMSC